MLKNIFIISILILFFQSSCKKDLKFQPQTIKNQNITMVIGISQNQQSILLKEYTSVAATSTAYSSKDHYDFLLKGIDANSGKTLMLTGWFYPTSTSSKYPTQATIQFNLFLFKDQDTLSLKNEIYSNPYIQKGKDINGEYLKISKNDAKLSYLRDILVDDQHSYTRVPFQFSDIKFYIKP